MKIIYRLSRLVFYFWKWATLSVFLGWATFASWTALIGTSSYLISYAALQPSIAELQVAIVGVRFFGIARGVFRYFERLVSHTTTFKILTNMRVQFYEGLEAIVPAGLKDQHSGDLLARIIDDIETLQEFYVRLIYPLLVAFLSCASVLWFVGSWSINFVIILLPFQIFVGIIVPTLSLVLSQKLGVELITNGSEIRQLAVDSIQGTSEVIAFGVSDKFERKMVGLGNRRASLQRKNHLIQGLNNGLISSGINICAVLLLILAIPMVNAGILDGKLLAVVVLGALVSFEAVLLLPSAVQNVGLNTKAGQRVFDLIDSDHISDVGLNNGGLTIGRINSVMATNVSFKYPGTGEEVLKGIDLEISSGKWVGLVGVSGVGKSTILNLLLRHWETSSGEIRMNGVNVRKFDPDEIRREISVISQSVYLFNTSIFENLRIGNPKASEDRIIEVAKIAGAHEFIRNLPAGYNTIVGERGSYLSGGEMQRIGIARALLKDASLYLMDEPLAHLDVISHNKIMKSILDNLKGKSILLVTHRQIGLQDMDEIIVVSKGSVVERGNYLELMNADGVFSSMWTNIKDKVFET